MAEQFDDRIYAVFERLFGVRAEELSPQTRRGDLEEWDSLGHILLVEALCDEFGVAISAEQALDLETISDIKMLIAKLKHD